MCKVAYRELSFAHKTRSQTNIFLKHVTTIKFLQMGNILRLYPAGIRFGQVFKRTMFFCSLFPTFEC